MSSAFDPFVLFVSFVVKQFCTSARSTGFFSRPLATLTQAAKICLRFTEEQVVTILTEPEITHSKR